MCGFMLISHHQVLYKFNYFFNVLFPTETSISKTFCKKEKKKIIEIFVTVVPGQELTEIAPIPVASVIQATNTTTTTQPSNTEPNVSQASSSAGLSNVDAAVPVSVASVSLAAGNMLNARPGSMVRVPEAIANGRKSNHLYFMSVFIIKNYG